MRDFQKVTNASIFPGMCISCKTSSGPFVDTNVNLPDNARVYLCKLCARRISEIMGFSEGEEMDRLIKSDVEIRDMENSVRDMERAVDQSRREAALSKQRLIDTERDLRRSEDEASRLLGIIDTIRIKMEEADYAAKA